MLNVWVPWLPYGFNTIHYEVISFDDKRFNRGIKILVLESAFEVIIGFILSVFVDVLWGNIPNVKNVGLG